MSSKRLHSMIHYHIRWGSSKLDWETFQTAEDAKAAAEQLVRTGETYTIHESDGDCPACAKTALSRFGSKDKVVLDEGIVRQTSDGPVNGDEYQMILDGAQAILWRAKLPGFQTTFTSKHVERILGFPVQSWLERPSLWIERIHPEDRDWVLRFTQEATEQGQNHEFEYRMIAADGRTLWLRNIVNVMLRGACPTEVIGLSVDITGRKRIQLGACQIHERDEATNVSDRR
jgi:PAS domain S-box-containing protein